LIPEPNPSETYSHTQRAPLWVLLIGSAFGCFAIAWFVRQTPGLYIASGTGVLILLLSTAFRELTIEDRGTWLEIRFGPLPVFRRCIPYDQMHFVELSRTTILTGWGIHHDLRGNWTWNLWGRDCVILHLRSGKFSVGTDDPENLTGFLRTKLHTPDPTEVP
jgi:hypothetical protein